MAIVDDWLLDVRHLHLALGRRPILEDIDLQVRRHTIHAIVGPNGAGKTSLMRSLLGAMPHRGEIRFRFRRSGTIGYVPQRLDFDPALPLTVGDFLSLMLQHRPVFFGRARRLRRRVETLLGRTGCARLVDRPMGALSGGELRRVLLAQALSPAPEVLLLDEPASNVDASGARLLEALLGELREDGVTIVMVGHDLGMIARLADRVTAINQTLRFSGEAQSLLDREVIGAIFGTSEDHALPAGLAS